MNTIYLIELGRHVEIGSVEHLEQVHRHARHQLVGTALAAGELHADGRLPKSLLDRLTEDAKHYRKAEDNLKRAEQAAKVPA